jgi:SpoVK/Ycf46/Vps4 family AAA+-type ATPase
MMITSVVDRCPLPATLVLTGPPGSGKTHLLRTIFHRHNRFSRVFSLTAAADLSRPDILNSISNKIDINNNNKAAVLVTLDGPGACSAVISFSERMQMRRLNVMLVVTAREAERGAGFPACCAVVVVRVPAPSRAERAVMLGAMLARVGAGPDVIDELAEKSLGFLPSDLLGMATHAVARAVERGDGKVGKEDLMEALAATTPAHASEFIMERGGSSSDGAHGAPAIAGCEEVIEQLRRHVVAPLASLDSYLRMGVRPPRGVLLTGPPGVGKTTIALMAARMAMANIFSVRGTDLLSSVVGESEVKLQRLFAAARASAPSIILLDRIESVAPVRGFDTSSEQSSDRLLSSLLVELDGVGGPREVVMVIATTDAKSSIDPALLRPGRMDIHIDVPLPDEPARRAILLSKLAEMPVPAPEAEEVAHAIAASSAGMSGADLENLCRECAMEVIRENYKVGNQDQWGKRLADKLKQRA